MYRDSIIIELFILGDIVLLLAHILSSVNVTFYSLSWYEQIITSGCSVFFPTVGSLESEAPIVLL